MQSEKDSYKNSGNSKIDHALISHGAKKYLSNAFLSSIEQVLRLVVSFFISILIIRQLGPSDFGLYAYVTSYVAIFSILARLGLNNLIVKELVEQNKRVSEIMNTVYTLRVLGALPIIFLMVAVSYFIEDDINTVILVCITSIGLIFQSAEIVDCFFQSKVIAKPVVVLKIAQLVISSLTKLYLLTIDAGVDAFLYLVLFDVIILSIFYFVSYRKQTNQNLSFNFNWKYFRQLLKLSWPIAISNLAMIAYFKMDMIMLFSMVDNEAVGIYAAASRISEAWYFIPTILTTTLFPAILHARSQSILDYKKKIRGLFSLLIWMGITIAILVTLMADWIINTLYGESFEEASKVLMIHIWVGIFIALGMAASRWFIAENLQHLFALRTWSGLVVNIFLNMVLIPKFSIIGAAIATLISVIFANVISYTFNKKLWPIFNLTMVSFNPWHLVKSLKELR
ncbi:flippase [Methylophaga sulfidovorans]|uniref:Membrane protein involved in the export of O-antigen and teichoic acid n=1 Tax=Methylophaga sulfidovorans TaxID=45496 RepID=A0A1I3YMF2_9GAMM|nr:flippase [Methylophaga sulfidovorans]SFK32985.1 Membrane protein involved in the export of O-antigen and teichoic acid [Methylophaga sulfidovorans]